MIDWLKKLLGQDPKAATEPTDDKLLYDEKFELICDILNKTGDASLLLSSTGDILFANNNFLERQGLTKEDVKCKVYDLGLYFTTEEMFYNRLRQTIDAGDSITFTRTLHVKTDPAEHTVQINMIRYKLQGQDSFCIISKDITELTNSRNELRELNSLLNVIIDNLPVYLFVKDVDNELRYLYWNKAFAEYSKIPASRVIGRTDYEVFPTYGDAQKFRDDDLEVIKTGEPINRHETYEAADGKTRIVQTLKTLVQREGRGPLLIGVSMDITNLQDIEQELVQERLRAEEADRLKSRFLANMSHEIRTPLNAIVGFSSLLAETDDEETRRQFADVINQNSEVLLQLINDILDLSKIEAGTLEYVRAPMDLIDTCRNIYEIHKGHIHPGVTLYFDNDESGMESFVINEDRNRISQVINNLINNASKFTKEGEIHFGFNVKDSCIKVYVKDTGIGIAPDKQSKIFDRFVKLDSFVQGTGLGLAICKLIVETMGGEMSLESYVGKGSTFSFTIPYHDDENAVLDPAQITIHTPSSFSREKKTILIAEDIESNYMYIKALLRNRYNLIWAQNGKEAVNLFKQYEPSLILMDIKMPTMNGLIATKMIRTYSSDVPIVALTANAFESDRKMSLDAGMNDYLAKPIKREDFEMILDKYLST